MSLKDQGNPAAAGQGRKESEVAAIVGVHYSTVYRHRDPGY